MTGRSAAPAALLLAITAALPAGAETTFVDVPGGRIAWERAGSGAPVVLVHDGLLPGASWDGVWTALAERFEVVRYDRRGYGGSTTTTRDFDDVADLLAVLDAAKLERVALVGCSAGGGLSLDFAIAHPERVSALVLEGPVLSGLAYSQHFMERGLRNRAPIRFDKDKAGTVAAWVEDPYLTDARNVDARKHLRALLEAYPQSATGEIRGSTRPPPDSRARLGELRVPVRLLVGESDVPDVHAHVGAIEAGVRGAERLVVAQAGHLVHLDKPEAFVRLVEEFLDPEGTALRLLAKGAGTRAAPETRKLFDYDRKAPLDLQGKDAPVRGKARVRDVSFASPLGGRAPAFVVEPQAAPKKGEKRAGLVFLHHGQGDRSTFLDEAARLAERGVVSVLLEAPDNRETDAPVPLPFDAESEEHAIRQTIVDLRRSFDLLEARADVDRRRLAYVGWSLGATMGSRLAGVEPRARGFVMIAGWASLTQAASQGHGVFGAVYDAWATGTRREAWRARIEPLDGTHFLDGRAPMLLQFATRDAYISRFDAALYAAAAFPGATSAEYDATHFEMGREDAARDREEWLARLLSLPPR